MSNEVTVRQHIRRRTGKSAHIAALLGIDPRVKVEPYKRRRPGMVAYRHQDDGSLCGDAVIHEMLPRRDKCPHGREVELA